MARSSNTGGRNYPAANSPGSAAFMKELAKTIKQPKLPNKNLTTNQYKMGLKKEESDV